MANPVPAIRPDANVFVSAIKPVPGVVDSLRILVHLLDAEPFGGRTG